MRTPDITRATLRVVTLTVLLGISCAASSSAQIAALWLSDRAHDLNLRPLHTALCDGGSGAQDALRGSLGLVTCSGTREGSALPDPTMGWDHLLLDPVGSNHGYHCVDGGRRTLPGRLLVAGRGGSEDSTAYVTTVTGLIDPANQPCEARDALLIGGRDCRTSRPTAAAKLVIAGYEIDPPPDYEERFLNWTGSLGDPARSVFHEDNAGSQTEECRAPLSIDSIVVHETGGFNFDDGSSAPRSWRDPPGEGLRTPIGAHFVVHTDGSITQHYDVVDFLHHGGERNRHSIGIELMNVAWSETETPNLSRAINREARASFRHGRRYYIAPTPVQLEALHQLMRYLSIVAGVPRVFPSVVEHGGGSYFILGQGGSGYYCGRDCDHPGYISHWNISRRRLNRAGEVISYGHADGGFPLLYVYVRSTQPSLSAAEAFDRTVATFRGKERPSRTFREEFLEGAISPWVVPLEVEAAEE